MQSTIKDFFSTNRLARLIFFFFVSNPIGKECLQYTMIKGLSVPKILLEQKKWGGHLYAFSKKVVTLCFKTKVIST